MIQLIEFLTLLKLITIYQPVNRTSQPTEPEEVEGSSEPHSEFFHVISLAVPPVAAMVLAAAPESSPASPAPQAARGRQMCQ